MQPDEERFLENFESDSIQFYPRDPILVVGSTLIEMPLYAPFRRKERFAIRRTIGERISQSNARVVSAPEPLPQNESEQTGYGPGPFLEGGDVFVLGRDIYVGNSGIASNKAGIRWLQDCLGEDYTVHEVRLSRKFLHLDCVLCAPRPGLAMVCEEAFLDGLPPFLKGWELIKVSFEDAERKLACNGLVLDESTILIAAELPELANELAKAGQTVVTTPFSAVYWQAVASENSIRRSGRLDRMSALEPRRDQLPRWRVHGCAGMSAKSAMVALGAGSCIWRPSIRRSRTRA